MVYEVAYCSECSKPIKSIPSWLNDVKVRFTCETCRQKHPKALAGYDAVVGARAAREEDGTDDPDILVAPDDEAGDEDVVDSEPLAEDVVEEP